MVGHPECCLISAPAKSAALSHIIIRYRTTWLIRPGEFAYDFSRSYTHMKRALQVIAVLVASSVALMASQEQARAYVSDCLCCLCSYLFGH